MLHSRASSGGRRGQRSVASVANLWRAPWLVAAWRCIACPRVGAAQIRPGDASRAEVYCRRTRGAVVLPGSGEGLAAADVRRLIAGGRETKRIGSATSASERLAYQ